MKVGILGWGSIGQRHGQNLWHLGHEPHYWDPAASNPHFTREKLIREHDAIIVASPSKFHAQDFMDAVQANKHVLVEKPFGYDCPPFLDGYLQSQRSIRPDIIIATGFNVRFHRCVRFTKGVLASGALGDIQAASFSVLQKSEKPDYLRDGIIRNWLSHEIDLAHFFFGDGTVESCTADDQREANIIMKFPTVKERVYLAADYYTKPQQRFFWIEGSKANIYVNLEKREVYMKEGTSAPCMVHQANDTWDDTYIEEMKAFIYSIEWSKHYCCYPLASGEEGVRALYTVMAAREAAGI